MPDRRDREHLSTREFEASRVDPRRLEAEAARTIQRLQTLAVAISLLIAVGVVATLIYTVQTVRLIEAQTGPAAQERSAARIDEILEAVDCDRQDDLDLVANVVAEILPDVEAERFRIRFHDRCPRRDLPSPLTTPDAEE